MESVKPTQTLGPSSSNLFIENQLLNYQEAAKYLSVSESHVYVGSRGVRFRVSSLNLWVDKREVTCLK
jgi:predicted DNA-binding transcriptional regulator AlpA